MNRTDGRDAFFKAQSLVSYFISHKPCHFLYVNWDTEKHLNMVSKANLSIRIHTEGKIQKASYKCAHTACSIRREQG